MTVTINKFTKKLGLRNLINTITRPNIRGGTCIDLIMTDSIYVLDAGVLNDFISDHYSIFSIRKKKRESHITVKRKVRDYRVFNENVFETILKGKNWDDFNATPNPDVQWEVILKYVNEILAIMCPYKIVNTRKKVTLWLTPDIYKAIREKKSLVKHYKAGKDPEILKALRTKRNYVNNLIEKSKSEYIKNMLRTNARKPKQENGAIAPETI